MTAKRKVGRPTKYDPETMPERARLLCLKGLTDVDLAAAFGVCEDTIYEWKHRYPNFSEVIKEAKDIFDSGNIERSLRQRAEGYSHPDVDIKQFNGEVIITPTVKHYPPDTTACIFWLKNRQPDRWRDKTEQDINVTGLADRMREARQRIQQGDDE
jgi:hypothetical protein